MDFDTQNLLSLGIAAVALALIVVVGMVRRELAPAARLHGRRRWLLAAALGAGVLTFSAKLLVVAGLSGIAAQPGDQRANATAVAGGTPLATASDTHVWTALPYSRAGVPTSPGAATTYVWQALPTQAPAPASNPMTAAKVRLGERLFNDPSLSHDRSVSCATCHDLFKQGGADGLVTARGIHGQTGTRNTPTVWNAAFQNLLFWDGRANSLEQQAVGPLLNPIEMGMPSAAAVVERVEQQASYRNAFDEAFGAGSEITLERIAAAIASYERSLITPDTPYDRFVAGDTRALSEQQRRGMAMFATLGCVSCHSGPNFSAASLFDTQAPRRLFPASPTPWEQRYALLEQSAADAPGVRMAWRVPSLRNVALTGPWLHNGAVSELADVVRIMAASQLGWSGHYLLWSARSRTVQEIDRPVPSEQQVQDIVAFLHALSSDRLVALTNAGGPADTRDTASVSSVHDVADGRRTAMGRAIP